MWALLVCDPSPTLRQLELWIEIKGSKDYEWFQIEEDDVNFEGICAKHHTKVALAHGWTPLHFWRLKYFGYIIAWFISYYSMRMG